MQSAAIVSPEERTLATTAPPLSERIVSVQRLPLLAGISQTELETIVASAREKSFTRREVILLEGDLVEQVVMLMSGSVKITQLCFGGDEVILRICGPGDMVSGFQAFAHSNHVFTAQAVQPSAALVWQVATFWNLLERFPVFRRNAVHALEQRLQELEERFREVSTERVCSRLSSELIRLSNRLGRASNGTSKISLSRAELAQLTGTTLFTISRLLRRWQALGIVRIGREEVHVRDFDALTRLSRNE